MIYAYASKRDVGPLEADMGETLMRVPETNKDTRREREPAPRCESLL